MTGKLEEYLKTGAREMGLDFTRESLEKYKIYSDYLEKENRKYNLTAIEEEKEVAVKHFLDSLACTKIIEPNNDFMIDLGTGAGFPGIPVKIYYPQLKILLVDSSRKKVEFLLKTIEILGLSQADARWDRAEVLGRSGELREKADIVVSRAVASLNVLAELCLPLIKIGGYFLAMKGPDVNNELVVSKKAISLLGGEVEKTMSYELPLIHLQRYLILIRKKYSTPEKYPRKPGIPEKRPIV